MLEYFLIKPFSVKQVLKDRGPKESDVKSWPVIGQFSSVGSLGPDKDKWLCSEWLQSMAQCRGVGRKMQGESGNKMLKLVRNLLDTK